MIRPNNSDSCLTAIGLYRWMHKSRDLMYHTACCSCVGIYIDVPQHVLTYVYMMGIYTIPVHSSLFTVHVISFVTLLLLDTILNGLMDQGELMELAGVFSQLKEALQTPEKARQQNPVRPVLACVCVCVCVYMYLTSSKCTLVCIHVYKCNVCSCCRMLRFQYLNY